MPTQLGRHFWPGFSFVYGLRIDYLSPTFYFTDLLILIIFLCSVKNIFSGLKKIKVKTLFIICVFFASLFLGIIFSKNIFVGIYGIFKLSELLFLAYYVSQKLKSFNKIIIFFLVFFSITFESLISFLQYTHQSSLGGLFYFLGERTFSAQTPGISNASINGQLILRPYGTFSHPNVLAAFLIVYMTCLLIFSSKFSLQKVFLFTGFFLGTVCLFLTLGRSAIIFWIICLIIFFAFTIFEKYKKTIANQLFIFVILITVIASIFIFVNLQKTLLFQRFSTTNTSDESLVQRGLLINESTQMFYKNPLLGVGINNFLNNLKFIDPKDQLTLLQPVHNIFLLVLSETGIVGFCVFLYFFYNGFSIIFSNNFKKRIYFLMLLSTVVFLGMFDHYFLTLQQGQLLLSIIAGIIFSHKNSTDFVRI